MNPIECGACLLTLICTLFDSHWVLDTLGHVPHLYCTIANRLTDKHSELFKVISFHDFDHDSVQIPFLNN